MSLVLIEGWDSLSAVDDVYTKLSTPTLDSTTKRTGSQSLKCTSQSIGCILPMPSNQDTYILGAAMWIESGATLTTNKSYQQIRFLGDGLYNCAISMGGGLIAVYRDTVQLGVSLAASFPEGEWFYLEVKATCKNSISTNDFIVRVNGAEVINLAATTDTQYSANQGISHIEIKGPHLTKTSYYDDLYVCDLLGGVNDDFLGDVKVETLYPSEDGNANEFVGSDSNSVDNYLLVDEAQQDGDTSYTQSDTPTELDLYTFGDLAGSPSTIHGVSTRSYLKKTEAGARTGKLQCRSGSTNYEGSEIFPGYSGYHGYDKIWEVDPDTAVAWIAAGVNGAEFGIKVHS